MDQPTTARSGGSPAAHIPSPTASAPTLKSAGAMAGAVKRAWAFSIPITAAASETRSRNGIMIRARDAESAACAGANPGAMPRTIGSANTSPASVRTPTTTRMRPMTVFAIR